MADQEITAHTIAQLVRAPTTSFGQAVRLIEQFATVAASAAAVKATRESHEALDATLKAITSEKVNHA